MTQWCNGEIITECRRTPSLFLMECGICLALMINWSMSKAAHGWKELWFRVHSASVSLTKVPGSRLVTGITWSVKVNRWPQHKSPLLSAFVLRGLQCLLREWIWRISPQPITVHLFLKNQEKLFLRFIAMGAEDFVWTEKKWKVSQTSTVQGNLLMRWRYRLVNRMIWNLILSIWEVMHSWTLILDLRKMWI